MRRTESRLGGQMKWVNAKVFTFRVATRGDYRGRDHRTTPRDLA